MTTTAWTGTRFDGRTAAGEIVRVALDGNVLRIVSRSRLDRVPLAQARIAESFRHAPAMVGLPGGVTLEVRDPEGTLGAALEAAGHPPSPVVRMQRHWPAALAALATLVALLGWGYVAGLPLLAGAVAQVIPQAVERDLGERMFAMLERRLERTQLPTARRRALQHAFDAAKTRVAPQAQVRLVFRGGRPNAYALPGGIIIVSDDLVKLAHDDDEILGVLGHELGHVVHRHSTRQVLQALGMTAVASLLWGDFSSTAANVPVVIGALRYSREAELEADDFAIGFMRADGRPVAALDAMFARLEAARGAGRSGSNGSNDRSFLSTHPSTEERRRRLGQAVETPPPRSPPTR
jgi:Zn-dependent protease with chaperone function